MKKKLRLMVVTIMMMVAFCAVSVAAKTASGSGQWKNSEYWIQTDGDYSRMIAMGTIVSQGVTQTILVSTYAGTQYGIATVQCKEYAQNVIRAENREEKELGANGIISPFLEGRAYGDSSVCYIHIGEIQDATSRKTLDKLTYTAWQNLVPSSTSAQEEN